MNDLIIVRPEKCMGCNACVRNCPAPEANITKMLDDGRFVTTVNSDRCIGCGECVKVCSHGARDYLDDTDACMTRIAKEKVIILAAPSIKTVFPKNWKGILDWFRKKGCLIYDVSLGADICTWAHLRAIETKKVGNIITQPCAAIVNYIETYQPKLLMNLSPIHSPVACAATYIKKYKNMSNPIAVLNPCIAKRREYKETGLVDYNVTFKKLHEYFEKNDIKPSSHSETDLEYNFDDQQGQLGAIYPRPGGLRDNLLAHDPELMITTSEGVHKIYPELDMYASVPEYKHPEIFDVLSCEFGCNLGPGSGSSQTVFDVMSSMKNIEKEARSRRKTGVVFRSGDDRLFRKFDEELKLSDFMRNYKAVPSTPKPTDKQLDEAYELMGKHTPQERNFNCHACGYKSCREMAIAICRGLNTPDNCIVHTKAILASSHSGLTKQNKQLSEITSACLELSENISKSIESITSSVDTIETSSSKIKDRTAVVNDLLKNVVTFCNENPTMDNNTVSQMIKILESTIKAFSVFDENVKITNENSSSINKSISEISALVKELNDKLQKKS